MVVSSFVCGIIVWSRKFFISLSVQQHGGKFDQGNIVANELWSLLVIFVTLTTSLISKLEISDGLDKERKNDLFASCDDIEGDRIS